MISKKWFAALPLVLLPFLAGCPDGGAEEVGEDIDEAVDDAKEAVEDAADEIEDEVDEIDSAE